MRNSKDDIQKSVLTFGWLVVSSIILSAIAVFIWGVYNMWVNKKLIKDIQILCLPMALGIYCIMIILLIPLRGTTMECKLGLNIELEKKYKENKNNIEDAYKAIMDELKHRTSGDIQLAITELHSISDSGQLAIIIAALSIAITSIIPLFLSFCFEVLKIRLWGLNVSLLIFDIIYSFFIKMCNDYKCIKIKRFILCVMTEFKNERLDQSKRKKYRAKKRITHR